MVHLDLFFRFSISSLTTIRYVSSSRPVVSPKLLASLPTISGSRSNMDFCVGFHPNNFFATIALALEFIPQGMSYGILAYPPSGVTFSISAVGMNFFLCAFFAMALATSPQTKSPLSARRCPSGPHVAPATLHSLLNKAQAYIARVLHMHHGPQVLPSLNLKTLPTLQCHLRQLIRLDAPLVIRPAPRPIDRRRAYNRRLEPRPAPSPPPTQSYPYCDTAPRPAG